MTDNRNDNLIRIIKNAKSGENASMEHLAKLFYQDIFRFVYWRTGQKMDAEDLTQDIFIKMTNKFKGLKDATGFKSWLYRIAINQVNDYHRKKRLLSLFTTIPDSKEYEIDQVGEDNPVKNIENKEFWQRFQMLTSRLSRKEREVFLLRFIDNLGIREISEALKKSQSTIKTHLYRAINKFKQSKEIRLFIKESIS